MGIVHGGYTGFGLDIPLNPLYVDEGRGMGDLALHIKTLEIFFSLYLPSLTEIQKALLKETIEDVYRQFGIVWDTDIHALKPSDFPRMEDVYRAVTGKADGSGDYAALSSLLRDIAVGATAGS